MPREVGEIGDEIRRIRTEVGEEGDSIPTEGCSASERTTCFEAEAVGGLAVGGGTREGRDASLVECRASLTRVGSRWLAIRHVSTGLRIPDKSLGRRYAVSVPDIAQQARRKIAELTRESSARRVALVARNARSIPDIA
eukprot:3517440-Rhodomonas_salina.2